jgi:hypothetical protein
VAVLHRFLKSREGFIYRSAMPVQKIRSGDSMFAPPNVAMQLTNNGPVTRRAFFIIIHDAAQPNGYHVSNWTPTGACDH